MIAGASAVEVKDNADGDALTSGTEVSNVIVRLNVVGVSVASMMTVGANTDVVSA